MTLREIDQIVDLERYPLDRPDSPRYRELLEEGRSAAASCALFSMVRFIRPEAIEPMAREVLARKAISSRYDRPRSPYVYTVDEPDWPESHPRAQRHRCSYNQVLNFQIPNDSPLRKIYYWQPLTEFLRRLCGFETFYRSDCPHFALTAKIAGEGDTDGWHFDSNDVVFSLLLQTPEAGGEFEYAPFVRGEKDESYDAVSRVFADPDKEALRPPLGLGDFNVFFGDLSLHRVRPVIGKRPRVVALFSYDRDPGMVFDQSYVEEMHQSLPGSGLPGLA